MLLDYNWFKQFIDPGINSEELGNKFHSLGFSLENVDDNIIDLEITPNRGDLQSIYGLAREFAASTGTRLKPFSAPIQVNKNSSDFVTISHKAQSSVLRYSYLIARRGKVQSSPDEIANRLKNQGLNPKNNIIDLTNYLMYESGQPIHAFDLSKISSINIDFANNKQSAQLLNGDTITLKEDNLIAHNKGKIIDLVGISGGAVPAVSDSTTEILIQAAIFSPEIIRQSSKSSGVKTPASYRYERGIDIELPLQALAVAKEMLEKYGFVVEEVVDLYPKPTNLKTINFDYAKIESVLGFAIDTEFIESSLYNLGFEIDNRLITVPSWRSHDINIPEDLIEEVLRIFGYDKIQSIALPVFKNPNITPNVFNENLKALLCNNGFTEVISSAFISTRECQLSDFNIDKVVEISNPLSDLNRYLRPTLKLKLIEAISTNPWLNDIVLFEIGNIFERPDHQTNMLGIISTKSIKSIDGIKSELHFESLDTEMPIMKHDKLRRRLYFLEISTESLKFETDTNINLTTGRYRKVSKFPPIILDIAIIVDQSVSPSDIERYIYSQSDKIIIAETFDEYVSDKFGSGKKSLAIHIIYQDISHTPLTDEIESLHILIKQKIVTQFNAIIR